MKHLAELVARSAVTCMRRGANGATAHTELRDPCVEQGLRGVAATHEPAQIAAEGAYRCARLAPLQRTSRPEAVHTTGAQTASLGLPAVKGERTGYAVLVWLEAEVGNGRWTAPLPEITVHSGNPVGRDRMLRVIRTIGWLHAAGREG